MNEYYQPTGQPRARQRGCFLKGCLTLFIVLMLMGMIIGGVGTYIYYGLAPFFSQEQAAIHVYPATDAQYQAVLAKIQPFSRAVATGTQATLDLTADELNILIARDPAWEDLRGRVYLALRNNDLVADVSVPADESGNAKVQIYFSARLFLGASIAGGEFTAVMHRIETLGGNPLPPLLARCVTGPGFAQSFDEGINRRIKDSPALENYINKLRTASIENHSIHVTSAGDPAPAAASPAPGDTPAAGAIATPVAAPSAPE